MILTERIWAWDYLNDYIFNLTGIKNDEFSVGGGGGVSFVFRFRTTRKGPWLEKDRTESNLAVLSQLRGQR